MSGGRWNDRARVALVLVGFVLVSLGVLATIRFRSDAGAAALVLGGLAVGLAGVAGSISMSRSRGAAAPESRLSAAAEAQQAGDTEGALDRFAQALGMYAPENAVYHEAATHAVYQAAGRAGEKVRPLYGFLLSPLAMTGSLVLVDIRGGTGFSLTRMQSTYQTLLVGPPAVFDAVLVVLNARTSHSIVDAVTQLGSALDRPVVGVGWRVGDPIEPLLVGIERLRGSLAERARVTLEPGGTRPDPVAGERPGPTVIDPVRPDFPGLIPPQGGPAEDSFSGDAGGGISANAGPAPGGAGTAYPQVPPQRPALPSAPSVEPARAFEPAPAVERPAIEAPPGPPAYDDSTAWRHATELHWQGQLQDAEAAYRQVIADRARALGPEHAETLAARDQHATVLRDLDRLGEAQRECEDVLAARTRTLGQDHPDTLTSRSHLATIYHQLGELTQAEAEHQRVLQARTRTLGENHQETLISRSNLAKVHQDLGELDRAVDEHRQVLEARARLLGQEHRDTLMSRSLLASALHQSRRLEEAEAQHRRVLRSRLRLLGPVHLDTAVSRHRLASVLHDIGRLNEAIAEYRAAYDIYADLLGPGSPFARAAASDLALAERLAAQS